MIKKIKPPKRPTKPKKDMFCIICKSVFKLDIVKEFKFHPIRKWRFDYAIPSLKIAIEQDGGIWISGRHNHPQGYINDMEKFNEATALGWVVLKFTPQNICSNEAIEVIKRTIDIRK